MLTSGEHRCAGGFGREGGIRLLITIKGVAPHLKIRALFIARPDDKKATTAPSTDIVERRKRLLDAAASLGAEHDSLVQEARGRLRRQLARELQSLAPFRFNRRKLQAHLRDEPMRAYVHYSQPAA